MHQSVGVLIKNEKSEILMLSRKNYPYGWACPAGHIDQGEGPEEAAHREVREETEIILKEIHKLFQEFIPWNECSQGVKGHYWHVYQAKSWLGEIKEKDKEADVIKWVKQGELKKLKLEPVWQYWFQKLNIL